MTLLPIVVRELRVAARQPKTYWLRTAGAGGFLLLAAWIYWETRRFRVGDGRDIFTVLSWIAWGVCLLAGPVFAADSLSQEKRENTLGLLFLTDLKGYDIVFGKLLSSSFAVLLGLLGLFPVLAVPILMGGVSYGEFGRVLLSLLNALFLSLSIGMSTSAAGRDASRTVAGCVAAVLVFALALPGIAELLRDYYKQSEAADVVKLFCPIYIHQVAMTFFGRRMTSDYWLGLICTHVVSWIALGSACWLAPRTWQDKAPERQQFFLKDWLQSWRRWNLGQTLAGRAFRTRALAMNPFFWLAGRERIMSLSFLLVAVALAGSAEWICWRYMVRSRGGTWEPGEAMLFVWVWVTVVMHALLFVRIAALASQRFGEDRHTGALELVLATPLSVGRILAGHWAALLRRCAGPIFTVLFLHAVLLWATAHEMTLDRGWPIGPWRLIAQSLTQVWGGAPPEGFEPAIIFINLISVGAVIICLQWATLGWVGQWLGLRLRHVPRNAPVVAMFLVFVPPWPVFGMLMYVLSHLDFLWGGEIAFFAFAMKLLVGLQVAHNVLLSVWAWRNLRKQFRAVATTRFQPARWSWPVFLRWRALARYALVAFGLYSLIAVAYVIERWRGARAWETVRKQAEARGENLRWSSMLPAAAERQLDFSQMPVFSNFLSSPLPYYYAPAAPLPITLQSVTVTGQPKGRAPQTPGSGHWTTGQRTDLEQSRKYYANARPFPKPAEPMDAASAVLFALDVFRLDLQELERIDAQPEALLQAWRKKNENNTEELWNVLYNLSELLNLRATAALALGRSNEALHDVHLALRVADVPRQEPRLSGQRVRYEIVEHSIQTIWEGLLDHRWSREQLIELRRELDRFNLSDGYGRAVRGESLWQIEQWNQVVSASSDSPPPRDWLRGPGTWEYLASYYPRGWAMQNQARIYRFYDERLRALVDSTTGRIRATPDLFQLEEFALRSARLNGSYATERYSYFIYSLARAETALRLARLGCALEQFQLDHGDYPATLEVLVPACLAALPLDVFTGEPMRYLRRQEGRYLLYSVGMNLKDDGGISQSDRDWVWHTEGINVTRRR